MSCALAILLTNVLPRATLTERSMAFWVLRTALRCNMKILILLIIVALTACANREQNTLPPPAPTAIPQSANANRASTEDDIREAVFRYQFTHNGSALRQKAEVYFLSFGEQDQEPDEEFLKRFARHEPPVKPASHAKALRGRKGTPAPFSNIVDKQTGKVGLIFYLRSIRWLSEDQVQVDGGYHEGPLSATSNRYTVVRENGAWVVLQDQVISVS